jgi:transcriptional regulator with XRE-family HTH domain
MNDAGQKLKRARERLNLRYRDVEQASLKIAERRQTEEFAIALSRLSDIENKGTVPTIYRLYSLCAIYRLDIAEVLEWYGVDLAVLPADAATIPLESTHLLGFGPGIYGDAQVPLVVDQGVDLSKTTYLSRAIRRWGKLPLSLLNAVDLKHHRYAFVGSEDWSMYPIIQPGALI